MTTDLNAFLPFLNGPLGFLFRHALGIHERRARVIKLTPDACHLRLGRNLYRAHFFTGPKFQEAAYRNLDWFMRSLHRYDVRIANRLAPAPNFGFDTYDSQPTEANANDTYIKSTDATSNFGTQSDLVMGESNTSSDNFRSLIKFDFSSLTWPVLVTSADLLLYHYQKAAGNTRTCRVYRQKRDWVEAQATWNIYKTGFDWITPGGFDSSDCEQTGIGAISLSPTEANGIKTWSLTTTAIDDMIDGSWTNYGFLLKNDTENNDLHRFYSSNGSTRPELTVEYKSQDTGGLWQ